MTTTFDLRGRQATLVALDIDGTIADPGTTEISDAVRAAVAEVRTAGHHVVVATGRSLVGVLPVARSLGLTEGWAVASNGAVTARLDLQAPGGYLLHDVQTFDPLPVVRRARSAYPGVQIAAEEVGLGYRVTRVFAPYEVNGAQRIVDVEKVAEQPTTRMILRSPGIANLRHKLQATGVTVNPDGRDWLDITPPQLSKATALEAVRILLDVHERRTIAVGDGINDIEMLTWAGRGVAMGHAPAEVLAAADDVTGTLEEDGAATVLRSLLPETVPAVR
ncbi:Hydroxymethylpyrimidine pyrophosphatase [Promicromonospora umidemergens]|uniref:HAD family hydrolase n=1 Tax=Promicromonospora umidemergens TaxID=629679 RepID=UPI0020A564AF|nr:HAD family hydrolase [Promicromonospora umidemergens]MCP2282786.1 Hydroxymethylpyrimidine pyrophosphatase [Promicromonospora umidemergens]